MMMFCKIESMHALSPTKEQRDFSRGLIIVHPLINQSIPCSSSTLFTPAILAIQSVQPVQPIHPVPMLRMSIGSHVTHNT